MGLVVSLLYGVPCMPQFNVGDSVRWVRALSYPEYKNSVGIVQAVIPNDNNLPGFTMYDVEFQFGLATLYGTQLEAEKGSST